MVSDDHTHSPGIVGETANPIVGQVWKLAEPLCLGEGMELVHVEYQREPAGRTLRIYMDKPGGVTLDDCVNVSRQLSDILDVGLDTQAAYRLEVSSPGLQRPLGRLDDFERYAGSRVKIRTARPISGQKNFTGALAGIEDMSVRITVGDQTKEIAFDNITKAHLINFNGEMPC